VVVVRLRGPGRPAGDVELTGLAVDVHRGTVYDRLRKAEHVCGLDLRNGEDVLTLHLGVKLLRLLQGPPERRRERVGSSAG